MDNDEDSPDNDANEGGELTIDATKPEETEDRLTKEEYDAEDVHLVMEKGEVTGVKLTHHTPKQSWIARLMAYFFGYEDK